MNRGPDNVDEINDESDHSSTDSSCVGYYTRSKRRKLDLDLEECTQCAKDYFERKSKHPFLNVPTEILQVIFRYISNHELSQTVRLVNRRFKMIAEDILNHDFKQIEKQLDILLKNTEISLGYTQDDMEIKCITKLLNMLEILKSQYAVIIATTWRFVFNDLYQTKSLCMYAGQIIDLHQTFFRKFILCPNLLYGPTVIKDYVLPPEIVKIVQLSKLFCVHFDKVVEEYNGQALTSSGSKIIDFLDVAQFAEREILVEEATNEIFLGSYRYFFRNSWFIAIPIAIAREMSLSLKQRMMHMRIRRIVLAHNDMYLQQYQFERELMLRPNTNAPIKRPGNNVYTGYGEVEDTFFYYGVMNEGSYLSKFEQPDDNEDDEIEDNIERNDEMEPGRQESDENILYAIPHLGVTVDVEVICPIMYAPRAYLDRLDNEGRLAKLKEGKRMKGNTQIKAKFHCQGASYPRLPTHYEYNFKPKTKDL